MATGWNTMVDNSQHDLLAKAYKCRGDTNYLVLNSIPFLKLVFDKVIFFLLTEKGARCRWLLGNTVNLVFTQRQNHGRSATLHSRLLTGKSLPHATSLDPSCFSINTALTTLSAKDAPKMEQVLNVSTLFPLYSSFCTVIKFFSNCLISR